MITYKNENYYEIGESASYLGVSKGYVYNNWPAWGWEPFHNAKKIFFSQATLDKWQSQNFKAGVPNHGRRKVNV